MGPKMHISGDTGYTDLWYPRTEESPVKFIEIGLMDVRATDNVRVSFDFEADGWKIEQDENIEDTDIDSEPSWVQVAFVPAWGACRAKFKQDN